jgi:hypothetical protein
MKRESIKQASERTGLSVKIVRKAALTGKIPFLRNGEGPTARILMLPEDVNKYVARCSNLKVLSPREYAACAREARGE